MRGQVSGGGNGVRESLECGREGDEVQSSIGLSFSKLKGLHRDLNPAAAVSSSE